MIRESMDFQGPGLPALFARVRMAGNFDDRSVLAAFGETRLRVDDLLDISRFYRVFYVNELPSDSEIANVAAEFAIFAGERVACSIIRRKVNTYRCFCVLGRNTTRRHRIDQPTNKQSNCICLKYREQLANIGSCRQDNQQLFVFIYRHT